MFSIYTYKAVSDVISDANSNLFVGMFYDGSDRRVAKNSVRPDLKNGCDRGYDGQLEEYPVGSQNGIYLKSDRTMGLITGLAFDPKGNIVYSSRSPSELVVLAPPHWWPRRTIMLPRAQAQDIEFDTAGHLFYSTGTTVVELDYATGKPIASFTFPLPSIGRFALSDGFPNQ